GLKENVIIGKLIPAGTGMKKYANIKLDTDGEEEEFFEEEEIVEETEAVEEMEAEDAEDADEVEEEITEEE
ncbi:MAG: hypothetical protein U0M58_03420, partial [Blautia sp.]|nr:hypothetical protein [Blautia sp.]